MDGIETSHCFGEIQVVTILFIMFEMYAFDYFDDIDDIFIVIIFHVAFQWLKFFLHKICALKNDEGLYILSVLGKLVQ